METGTPSAFENQLTYAAALGALDEKDYETYRGLPWVAIELREGVARVIDGDGSLVELKKRNEKEGDEGAVRILFDHGIAS